MFKRFYAADIYVKDMPDTNNKETEKWEKTANKIEFLQKDFDKRN